MINHHETLQEYVRRILASKGLTETGVSRNSGGRISRSSVSDIVTGKRICATLSKLQALARGLGVSEEEIIARARGVRSAVNSEISHGVFARLQTKYLELNNDDKSAILTLVEMLEHEIDLRLSRRNEGGDQQGDGLNNGHGTASW
ncbi:MAG: helix-turn-helix domain-containing protein [Blastocatellales bacterium]